MNQKHVPRWKQIFLILFIFLLNVSGKTWRDFPRHYRSLTYVGFINLVYYLLCKRHLVWEFTPLDFNWKLLRFIHVLFITPSLVLLFLSKFPESLLKRTFYLVKFVLCSTLVEYIAHRQKLIQFKHGWNIYWSSLLYAMMYVFSYLFEKKPKITSFLSVCSIVFFIIKFNVPIRSKHPFSRRHDILVDFFYHSPLEDIF